jgi:hypothetical protein
MAPIRFEAFSLGLSPIKTQLWAGPRTLPKHIHLVVDVSHRCGPPREMSSDVSETIRKRIIQKNAKCRSLDAFTIVRASSS